MSQEPTHSGLWIRFSSSIKMRKHLFLAGGIGWMVLLVSCHKYQFAHVFMGFPSTKIHSIRFFEKPDPDLPPQVFPEKDDAYLKVLRETYRLDSVAGNSANELDKVLAIMAWAHSRWRHNGSQMPKKSDALSILKEAESGMRFRCVEYGIVLADALLSVGFKARVLGLKTRDVETAKSGAGHVLAEVWLPSRKKWILADAQFDLIPVLDGVPLNAVEFQQALFEKKAFQLVNKEGQVLKQNRRRFLQFIGYYLYYMDTAFDQRRSPGLANRFLHEGRRSLMLVPEEAPNPVRFQIGSAIDYAWYTYSKGSFYRAP
jgi:transglutaminase-like putative cysteine protease